MLITNVNTVRVSEEQLAEWELRHGMSLPSDYRRFLLTYNGGRPIPACFSVPGWPGESSGVGDFLGLQPGKPCDIDSWISEFADRLPPDLVPIACDPGGNFLCMAVSGERCGEVYYWDSSPDWGLTEETGTLFKVADNFDRFLGLLHDI